MKRAVFILAGIALLLVSGCQKEKTEVPSGTPVQTSYTVSLDGWLFSKGDRISLLSNSYTATITAESSGESVVFSGNVPKLAPGESYIAIYPASDEYKLEGTSIRIALPSAIVPQNGHPVGAVAAGIPKDGALSLNHATSFVRFTTTREDISSLVIRSDGKNLAGVMTLAVNNSGIPSVTVTDGANALIIHDVLTPGTYTVPVLAQGYNGFSMDITAAEGSGKKVISQAKRLTPGMIMDLGTVDDVELNQAASVPVLEVIETAASTASVTWSISGFNDVYSDIAQRWSAGIYNDAACTDLRVSWNFPSSIWTLCEGSNISTVEGPYSPRFVFSSLEPDTEYYVKVWYTDNPSSASEVLTIKTKQAAYKTLPEGFAAEGNVLLQEDFSELPWGGDISKRCFGYSDKNRGSAPSLDAAHGENPIGEQTIDGFKHSWYFVNPTTEMGLFNTLRNAVSKTRLSAWTSIAEDNTDGKVLARPGYVKLGSSSKTGGIVIPSLSCLEHRAQVRLSFKAHPFRESVNDPLTGSVMVISSEENGVSVLKEYAISQQENFSVGETQEWKEYSFELTVQPGERIAISSRREGTDANQRRLLIDDIKVELLEYRPVVKVTAIRDSQDWLNFVSGYASYEKLECVTIENDLDLSGIEFEPIPTFVGTLDGKGHSIKNWESQGMPLFKSLSGTVKDLVIDKSCSLQFDAVPDAPFGFVVADIQNTGVLDGVINNADISHTVSITGEASAVLSPIAGRSYGLIRNCVNNGNVQLIASAANKNVYLGGIVGYFNAGDRVALDNNVNHGDISYRVNAKGALVYMGGITAGTSTTAIASAKSSKGTIDHCINTGNVSYYSTNGGSMEENAGTTGTGNYFKVGGIAGYVEGYVTNCTNGVSGDTSKGQVSVTVPTSESGSCATGPSIGGISAFVMRNMSDCTNYGKVSLTGTFAGGNTANAGNGITADLCAGGIVGQIGPQEEYDQYQLSGCHNYGELDIIAWMAGSNGTRFDFGGVAGYSHIPVKACSNKGKITVSTKGKFNEIGGVVGWAKRGVSQLSNEGLLSFSLLRTASSGGQIADAQHMGGVVGWAEADGTDLENKSSRMEATVSGESGELFCGGVAGKAAAASNLTNLADIAMTIKTGAQLRFGGVVGNNTGALTGELRNDANLSLNISDAAKNLTFGGVVGWANGNVSACTNGSVKDAKTMTYHGATSASTWIGGCVAYTATGFSSSGWTNYEKVHVESMATNKARIAGVLGEIGANANGDTSEYTYSSLTNHGSILNENVTTTECFVGGVSAGGNTYKVYHSCVNDGDINHSGNIQRLGGCLAYTDRVNLSGRSSSSELSATCTITIDAKNSGAYVGGVLGYAFAAPKSMYFTGSIDAGSSTSSPWIGGIQGHTGNSNVVFDDCRFSGSVQGRASNYAALICAGSNTASKTYTFKDCTVAKGSILNGSAISALTPEILVYGHNSPTVTTDGVSLVD